MALNDRMLMNSQQRSKRLRPNLRQHFLGVTEENHEKISLGSWYPYEGSNWAHPIQLAQQENGISGAGLV